MQGAAPAVDAGEGGDGCVCFAEWDYGKDFLFCMFSRFAFLSHKKSNTVK